MYFAWQEKKARKVSSEAGFVGFEIPNKLIMGYNFDYAELGRNLASIYVANDWYLSYFCFFYDIYLVKLINEMGENTKSNKNDNCFVLCPHCNNPMYINVDVIIGEEHELVLDPDELEFVGDEDCFFLEPKHNMSIYTYTIKGDIYVYCERCDTSWSVKPSQITFERYTDMVDHVTEVVRDILMGSD